MMKRWLFLLAIPLALAFSPSTPRAEQQNQNSVDLNGIWKVSGNQYDEGKEVCIKQTAQSIEARFFFKGQGVCPIEDSRNGVFLYGTAQDSVLKGTIRLCTVVEKLVTDCRLGGWYESEFDGTAGTDRISIRFHVDHVDYDVDQRLGFWTNCRLIPKGGDEVNVTLTREPCPQDVCSYQITDEEVQRAVFKALKEHNVQLDPAAQNLLNMRGIGVKGTVEYKAGKSEIGNRTGFVIWLKPAPIMVVGLVSHTSCTSADGAGLAVQLVVWQVRVENGNVKSLYKPLQDVTKKGSFDQKGLDQAMKAGFDQTKLNQYKTPPPPS